MKLLVVGCGSIGRRHAANATRFASTAVFDQDRQRAEEAAVDGQAIFDDLDTALAWGPDGVVVAAPHDRHLDLAKVAVDAGCHVLIEKPISHELAGLADFLARAKATDRVVQVVCNMRFHPGPATLKEHLPAIGTALFARAQFGNYLPNMRPNADYKVLYCAHASRGGGVILDAIHEIDYTMWLLGNVAAVNCTAAKLSDLEIDVEDYASITMEHTGGARSEIHLDYLQQYKRRGCEIVGTEGTLLWETTGKLPERCRVRLFTRSSGAWRDLIDIDEVDNAAPYVEVMRRFASSIEGGDAEGLLEGGQAVSELAVALTAKRSAETGTRLAVTSV